jgi:pilus assembly protein Flp/PilA
MPIWTRLRGHFPGAVPSRPPTEAGRAAIDETLAAAEEIDGIIAGLPDESPTESILSERPALSIARSIARSTSMPSRGLWSGGTAESGDDGDKTPPIDETYDGSPASGHPMRAATIAESCRPTLIVGPPVFIPMEGSSMLSLRERGQGLAEYALILALIAILAIGALGVLSGTINSILSRVGSVL